jgi:ABC-type transport system involved in multi-copper enzyme maturation permease subunit
MMVGPLYYYELVRLARKGRSFVVRCSFALLVFATLFWVYRDKFPRYDPILNPFATEAAKEAELAHLAHDFVTAMLVVQTVAILVLTPAYVAGAVSGERERGTLDLLLMSHLRDREIVLGKLAARVTHLGGVILAGLPILAVTQVWGGVDFFALLAAFLAVGLNLVSLGGLSVACSVQNRTTGEALASAYAFILTYLVVLGVACLRLSYPFATTGFGVFFEMTRGPHPAVSPGAAPFVPLATCAAVNGAIAAITIVSAVVSLRSAESRARRRKAATPVVPAPAKTKKKPASRPPSRLFPPVGDRPLLWKEINPSPSPREHRFLNRYWPVPVLLALLAGCLISTAVGADSHHATSLTLIGFTTLLYPAVIWCWAVGFRAAMSVCRERERNTLEGLLTLPVSRSHVLGAKWLGAILYFRIYYFVMPALAYLVGIGIAHPLRALLLPVAFTAQIAFLSSLGLRVSVASPSVVRAQVVITLFLLVIFAGGWVVWSMDSEAANAVDHFATASDRRANAPTPGLQHVRGLFYTIGLNPVGSWAFLSGLRKTGGDPDFNRQFLRTQYAVAACGTLIYALAAGVLWLDACRCFRAEPKG